MKIPVYLVVIICMCGNLSAQKKIPRSFKLSGYQDNVSETASAPSGNFVSEIKIVSDTAFTANERGLSITTNGGFSWQNFFREDGIYKGSISAIAFHRSILFVSTIFDSVISPQPTSGVGGGISYSSDFGAAWAHIPQPLDGPAGFIIRPNGDTIPIVSVRTAIDNTIFDLAATDSSIWIASFAGGIRSAKINSDGSIAGFLLMALPPDALDEILPSQNYNFTINAFANLNHRAFSVMAARDGIWAGTANGINHSTDGGLSWRKYTHQNSGIAGNFVTALGEQIYTDSAGTHRNIWAATNFAVDNTESNGLSYTSDSGTTWHVALQGPFVNNIAFDGKTVYAATVFGMYRSANLGATWESVTTLVDKNTGDRNYTTEFTTVGIENPGPTRKLYFGTIDGLAVSDDNGVTWTFQRAHVTPGKNGVPKSYAYPNPFSPGHEPNVVRFQFDKTGMDSVSDKATIKIYDFAMDLVATVARDVPVSQTFAWTGVSNRGDRVANGTYIYVIEAGKKKFWGKVTVRN